MENCHSVKVDHGSLKKKKKSQTYFGVLVCVRVCVSEDFLCGDADDEW